jgi:serine/threonine protein kinase
MAPQFQRVKEVFLGAVEKADLAERADYLDAACAGDAALLQQVEALLQKHEQAGSFLRPPAVPQSTLDTAVGGRAGGHANPRQSVPTEAAGDRIGPYELLQKLGEGGMGVVWSAEQTDPVKRHVALKVIKPGMDSVQVLRRFEAERQALALMDHPNIAKVLDAGATPGGRPYFVMELIQGVPITKYCDEHHLSVRERLELFVHVCRAIQHAHQKGVIHRDVKPNNVLVCTQDGKPVPKVIDFGVAKALHQRLTDETFYTEIGAIVGSLEYMSPEQAEVSPLGVDTRADVYALGVLLYELLTGTTPLGPGRLLWTGYAEVLRLIREETPAKPSTRLTQSAESLPSVAALRRTEPVRLAKELRGDLDWIVMKALEKDRSRRYEAASSFARDVERYLSDEPVEACPPSARYRLSKFLRRHRGPVLAGLGLVGLLVAGIVGTSWGLLHADRARREAVSAREAEAEQRRVAEERENETRAVLDFVETRVLGAARPEGEGDGLGRDVSLRKAMETALPFVEQGFRGQPLIEARLRRTIGVSFRSLGELATAAEQFQKAHTLYAEQFGPDHPATVRVLGDVANSYQDLGKRTDALHLREELLAIQTARFGRDHPDTIWTMAGLANSYNSLGRYADARRLYEEVLARRKAALGCDHLETLRAMNNLGYNYTNLGRYTDALQLFETSLPRCKDCLGPDHPETLKSMHGLACSYHFLNRFAEAVKYHEQALALRKAKLGPDHPETLDSINEVARSYFGLGRHAEALKLREQAVALRTAKLGPEHPDTLMSKWGLADSYTAVGRFTDAVTLYKETLALYETKLGPEHPDTLNCSDNLAVAYAGLGRYDDAIEHFKKTLQVRSAKLGPQHPDNLIATYNIACCYALAVPRAPDPAKRADLAMEWLKKAVAAGYHDAAQIKKDADADFKAVRDRDDFKKLLGDLESRQQKDKK